MLEPNNTLMLNFVLSNLQYLDEVALSLRCLHILYLADFSAINHTPILTLITLYSLYLYFRFLSLFDIQLNCLFFALLFIYTYFCPCAAKTPEFPRWESIKADLIWLVHMMTFRKCPGLEMRNCFCLPLKSGAHCFKNH